MRLARIAVLALIAAACDPGDVDLEGRECPCVSGWVCDTVTQRCVASSADAMVRDGAAMDARSDSGPFDAGPFDAGRFDAGPFDAGAPFDAGPIDGGPPALDPPWWDVAWGYRAQITITNTSTAEAAPAAFPVLYRATLSSLPTNPPRSRLRIVRWDASSRSWSEIDYAADAGSPSVSGAPIWFPLVAPIAAGATDRTYWLYWGNDAADDSRDPNRVFPVWHSFFTLPSSGWFIEDPVSVNASNELVLSRGGSIRSAARYGPGYAVDFMMIVPTFSAYFWGGFQRETDFVDGEPWIIWINRDWDPGRIWPEVKISAIGHATGLEGSHLTFDSAEHYYSVERYADRAMFVRDYADVSQVDFGASYTNALQVRLRSSPATGPEMRFDWVRIRPVMRPMPTVELGATEAAP